MEPDKKTSLHHSNTPLSHVIDVSAALIFQNGRLLITLRHADAHLGGLWEFPGGKREAAETFEQCLAREIREELGAEIDVGRRFESVTHAYPDKTVHLEFFLCRLKSGEPRPLGCADLKWISRSELENYPFPAADAQLLEKLQSSPELWKADRGSGRARCPYRADRSDPAARWGQRALP